MNFVEYYVQQMPTEERPIIVHFDPWWFSGREDLTKRFFRQIQSVLVENKSLIKRLRGGKKDLRELKENIESVLKKQQKRILVIIDDIDRLTADETAQLFRVIKAIADFPNVIYLLAFDRNVVAHALHAELRMPGEDYLKKIIQVSVELLLPDRMSLRQVLRSSLPCWDLRIEFGA